MSEETAGLKKLAAERAVEFVESGMVVGLGSGSTTLYAVRRIGELVREGGYRRARAVLGAGYRRGRRRPGRRSLSWEK